MRTIDFTGQFKRDYKRESKGAHKKTLAKDLSDALNLLRAGKKLPKKYYDHPLVGDLLGVYVYKFRLSEQQCLLAYRILNRDSIKLLIFGHHENFYRDLKR